MSKRRKQAAVPSVAELPFDNYEINCEADLPVDLPWSISCLYCDCDSPDSWALAVVRGWTEIAVDRAGLSWNFLGVCPDCQDQHD